MPFNIWCDGCHNNIRHGGVRYNAEKKKVGNYSRPFRMKCHLCVNHIELQTDPGNCDYVIVSGARRKEERWEPGDSEQVLPSSPEQRQRLATDAMFRLEHGVSDRGALERAAPTLTRLQEAQSAWKDDFGLNSRLRRRFREEKKTLREEEEEAAALARKAGLGIACAPRGGGGSAAAYEQRQRLKRSEISQRSWFGAGTSRTPPQKLGLGASRTPPGPPPTPAGLGIVRRGAGTPRDPPQDGGTPPQTGEPPRDPPPNCGTPPGPPKLRDPPPHLWSPIIPTPVPTAPEGDLGGGEGPPPNTPRPPNPPETPPQIPPRPPNTPDPRTPILTPRPPPQSPHALFGDPKSFFGEGSQVRSSPRRCGGLRPSPLIWGTPKSSRGRGSQGFLCVPSPTFGVLGF
uniref:Probable splicing factor YJU2B n=1 Tax=Geospiza parvula TaxID=87175 RepID=A0A8U8C367_GEOPR